MFDSVRVARHRLYAIDYCQRVNAEYTNDQYPNLNIMFNFYCISHQAADSVAPPKLTQNPEVGPLHVQYKLKETNLNGYGKSESERWFQRSGYYDAYRNQRFIIVKSQPVCDPATEEERALRRTEERSSYTVKWIVRCVRGTLVIHGRLKGSSHRNRAKLNTTRWSEVSSFRKPYLAVQSWGICPERGS